MNGIETQKETRSRDGSLTYDAAESTGFESTCAPSSAAAFVDHLAEKAVQHRAVTHPYLVALSKGELPDMAFALADFARHYRGYSSYFPRYLTAVISRLPDTEHREALLQNLTEEQGTYEVEELEALRALGIEDDWYVGIPHPELFSRFCRAAGVDVTAAAPPHIEVACWREQLLLLLQSGSIAEAVGALGLGTETVVRPMYGYFVEALQRIGTISPKDSVFFPLHSAVDDEHQATLKEIASHYCLTENGRKDVERGMYKALALRDTFWNWLHRRAMCPHASGVD